MSNLNEPTVKARSFKEKVYKSLFINGMDQKIEPLMFTTGDKGANVTLHFASLADYACKVEALAYALRTINLFVLENPGDHLWASSGKTLDLSDLLVTMLAPNYPLFETLDEGLDKDLQ